MSPPPLPPLHCTHACCPYNAIYRVWDLVTGAQRYQFSSPSDQPTCVTYAPSRPTSNGAEELLSAGGVAIEGRGGGGGGGGGDDDGEEWHLVAGYTSGAMRVFHVPSTRTLFECQQHRGSVQQVGGGTTAVVV